MALFTKDKFSRLTINPYGKDDQFMQRELRKGKLSVGLEGINEIRDRLMFTRYILYLYDQNTPLTEMFPDIVKRKRQAAELAGYNMDRDLDHVYGLTDERYRRIVLNFIRWQNNMEWGMLISQEELFWHTNDKIMELSNETDESKLVKVMETKAKLVAQCQKIMENVNQLRSKLSRRDEVLEQIIVSATKWTPEKVAMKLRNVHKAPEE